MADLRVLKLALLAETKEFLKGLDDATKGAKTFDQKLSGILASGAKAFAGLVTAVGGLAIVIGKDLVEGAIEGQKEFFQLENAMRNYADATDISINATNKWIDAQGRATGFGGDQLIPGFERLLRSVNDVTKAQELLVLAQDIARATGKDLNQVTDALASAEDGRTKALRDLGIELQTERTITRRVTVSKKDIKKATLDQEGAEIRLSKAQESASKALSKYGEESNQYKSALNSLEKAKISAGDASDKLEGKIKNQGKTVSTTKKEAVEFDEIVAQLTEKFQGSAARYAETYAGKVEILRESVAQLKDQLGEQLLPFLTRIVDFLKGPALSAFTGFTRALTGGPRSAKGATKETNSAFAELGIVFNENDQAGYNLGQAILNLTEAFGKLFREVNTGNAPDGSFARLITNVTNLTDSLTGLIEKLAGAIDLYRTLNDLASKIPGLGGFGESQAVLANTPAISPGAAARLNPQVNINVKGAVDPQGTARTVKKVFDTARRTTGLKITAPAGFF